MSILKMVDGVMSMGVMSVVMVVISCHIFLCFFDLVLVFGFSDFYSFCLTIMVVICLFVCLFFFNLFIKNMFSFCTALVGHH